MRYTASCVQIHGARMQGERQANRFCRDIGVIWPRFHPFLLRSGDNIETLSGLHDYGLAAKVTLRYGAQHQHPRNRSLQRAGFCVTARCAGVPLVPLRNLSSKDGGSRHGCCAISPGGRHRGLVAAVLHGISKRWGLSGTPKTVGVAAFHRQHFVKWISRHGVLRSRHYGLCLRQPDMSPVSGDSAARRRFKSLTPAQMDIT